MEKLSIEKFREYCEFTKRLYELVLDESKMESMSEEEASKIEEDLEKMEETLTSSDLSDIPFEEWENFVFINQDLNLENTGANIDFNLINIPLELSRYKINVNLRGCNVRNFSFDKTKFRYSSESFDPEFVEEAIAQNGTLFPERSITDQDVKERLRLGRVTLQDIKKYNMQSYIEKEQMEFHTSYIIEKIGMERALEIDDEIIADESLFGRFYNAVMQNDGEYSLDAARERMIENIEEDFFGYRAKETYERYENNPYIRSRLPQIFIDFPEGTDEKLKDAVKEKSLSITQVIDNYELFKGKKILKRLKDNGYYGLQESYPEISDERIGFLIENFPDIVEIYKENPTFIYRMANEADPTKGVENLRTEFVQKIKERVLKNGVEDERELDLIPYKDIALEFSKDSYHLEYVEKFLGQEENIALLREKHISPLVFKSNAFVDAISIFGFRTLLDFDERNGNILTKNNNQVLLSIDEKFLHYGGNIHDPLMTIFTKGWDFKEGKYVGSDLEEYTKEEFDESFRRMIVYGPTNWNYSSDPIPFWEMEGEFRENNPDLFVSENVPEDLATLFYQSSFNLDDIRFSGEDRESAIREILSKNRTLAFRRSGIKFDIEKMDLDILFAIAKENGSYLNLLENPAETSYYRSYEIGKFSFEDKSLEEVQTLARTLIEKGIVEGKIPYGEKAPEYFKEAHPELFLSQDAPEELKLIYYKKVDEENYRSETNRIEKTKDLSIDLLSKHPEYVEFLRGKSLAYANVDSKLKKFIQEFGEEQFFDLLEEEPEAINIIANAGTTSIERFKTLLETRPNFYAQKELKENDGYTEDELSLILSGEETQDERILQGRKLLESKKEKFRDFIISSPGYVIHCPDEKLDDFNFTEYKELERLSKFDVSDNYRRDTAEQIITSMYCFLGYGASKEVLKLPEVSEDELEAAIRNTGLAVSGIYENVYSVQGNLKTLSILFDKFGPMLPGGKKNFAVYKSLNEKLEEGYDGPIDELLRLCLLENDCEFSDSRLETVTKNAIDVNTTGKMDLIKDDIENYLRTNIQETPENIKILNDLLNTALKRSFSTHEKLNFVTIQEYIQKEFARTRPDGTSFYSPHVTGHMQELLDAVSELQNNPEIAARLNLSVTDILKEEKTKIGKGWIRKLLDIKTKLTEKEKEVLEARLYGESGIKIDATKSLELKDKSEEGIEEAYILLKEMELPGVFTFEKGEIMFAGLTTPYSENFRDFFLANKTEILRKPEFYTEFQNMHKRMEAVIKDPNILIRYQSGRYTVQELLDDIKNISYDNIEPGEHELAYRAKKSNLTQEEFNIAKEIYKKMLEREKQTVPPVEYQGKRYVGRILRIDDPLHFTIGNITTCCQRFGEGQPGETSMLHSATEENGSVFVIEEVDEYGNVVKPVAQSWTWRNGDRVCFDNVEIPNTIMSELSAKGAYDDIFEIYRSVAEKMIDIDKKSLKRLLDEGKITKEQYEALVIKQVTIGTGCDDLIRNISGENRKGLKDASTVAPEEIGKRYSGVNKDRGLYVDSHHQYVLAENDEVKTKKSGIRLADIAFGYTRKRDSIRKKDGEIHPDLVARCKAINERAGEETKAQSIISRLESNNITALTRDYYSELNGRSLTLDFSEHDDWYILSSEGDRDIRIDDSILLPYDGASLDEIKLAKMEYAKQFLLIAKQAREKGKTLKVNLEREGKFLDFDKFSEKDIISKLSDGTIQIKDAEKLEELLKSLDTRIQESRDKRVVDTAVGGPKPEDTSLDERE